MSATQERTETGEEEIARLMVRMDKGFTEIGRATSQGLPVDHWFEAWLGILRRYERLEDEMAAHHAEVRQQAEMAGMPRRERTA